MLDAGFDKAQNMIFHRALVEILNEDLNGRNKIWRKVYNLAKQRGDFHQSKHLITCSNNHVIHRNKN